MASRDKRNDAAKARGNGSRKGTAAVSEREAKALRGLGVLGPHGEMELPSVRILGYSLEMRDGAGRLTFCYLKEEICGFAIHLMERRP